jgi:hypothetical protein
MDFKALRAKRNDKARSMIESSGGKVDSSDFTPAEMLNADVKTGMRPISRRAFKAGGKVEGADAKTNLSRSPRGFKETVGLANTNQKDANEEREGIKHVGGFKRGGRAGYQTYGAVSAAELDAVGPRTGGEASESKKERMISPSEADRLMAESNAEQRRIGDLTRRKHGGKAESDGYARGGSKMKKAAERDIGETMAEEEMPSYKAKKIGRKAMKDMPTADIRKKMGDDRSMERGALMPSMNDDPYKRGGKAEGSAKDMMEDKKMAAKRGMSMKEWEASSADKKHDMPSAGKLKMVEKDGKKVPDFAADGIGNMKSGGRTGKMSGGSMGMGMGMGMPSSPMMPAMNPMASGYKSGGKAMHHKDCMCKACGGSAGMKDGGGLYANINAKRERIENGSKEKMRKVGSKGAPDAQDFKESAKTAKKEMGGRMGRATGGRTKGTTNISINVMPHNANKPMGIQPPMPPMPMPPMGGPPPMMPPPPRMSLPPGLGAAMADASGAGPMPPPPGAPMPMMGRKAGGKVYPKMEYGSGGGKGRLEKIDEYGKNA